MERIALPTLGLWRPAPGVYLAFVAEDLVFLDVGADRYLCLPGVGPDVAKTPEGLRIRDPALAADLSDAGLLEPGAASVRQAPAALPLATATALVDRAGRIRLGDVAEMTASLADLAVSYRARSFSRLLEGVRRSRPPRAVIEVGALVEVVSRFQRWLPYAPAPAKCLLRSFMLLRLLHRRGLDASWVFGVATWPFRAHCWLQAGELALDEHPDRLRAFTPIMVV